MHFCMCLIIYPWKIWKIGTLTDRYRRVVLLSNVLNQSEIVVLLRLFSGQGTTRCRMGQGLEHFLSWTHNSIQTRCLVFKLIFFNSNNTPSCVYCLSVCKNRTIHRTTLNNAKNIPLSEYIAANVLFTLILSSSPPPPSPSEDTDSCLIKVGC